MKFNVKKKPIIGIVIKGEERTTIKLIVEAR